MNNTQLEDAQGKLKYYVIEHKDDPKTPELDAGLDEMLAVIRNISDKVLPENPAKSLLVNLQNIIDETRTNSDPRPKKLWFRQTKGAKSGTLKSISILPINTPVLDQNLDYELMAALTLYLSRDNTPFNIQTILQHPRQGEMYLKVLMHYELQGKFIPAEKQEHIDRAISRAESAAESVDKKLAAVDKAISDRLLEFDAEYESKKATMDDLIALSKAYTKYKQLAEYFEDKAISHRLGFWVWLTMFIALLLIAAFAVVFFHANIAALLPSWESGTAASPGKFTLGIPVIIIVSIIMGTWVLRTFIRLAMLNLQLKEDAENRTVLIRTLAALESEKDGKISKAERLIAYNAIFRSSLSDSANLDVAHPTIADFGGMFGKK